MSSAATGSCESTDTPLLDKRDSTREARRDDKSLERLLALVATSVRDIAPVLRHRDHALTVEVDRRRGLLQGPR
ncbi:MAG: hypothetical protein FJ294_03660 [Planctomycetes bacterium]|nr:hypothetical protein [Planctomycetota bacterium]